MRAHLLASLLALAIPAAVCAQSSLVVPASASANDAMSYEWVAGASQLHRQQTLIGQSHLLLLVGRQVAAVELRRTAVTDAFAQGAANLVVVLSTSPNAPANCDNHFAANVGPDATLVFQGPVTFPASPATGPSGSPVSWTVNNTLRIQFTTPFVYQGGTLCVDVQGTPIVGQKTWWMADATEEVVPGTATVEIGAGCGVYGGPTHVWSEVQERSLVPGGYGVFRAEGPANGPALAMFGAAAQAPFPLSLLGIPTPGCMLHLDATAIHVMMPAVFEPETHPQAFGAIAEVLVRIPATPSVFGFTMTTQWFDLLQLATSNAITWTVANAIPQLDMALVEGHPSLPYGTVSTYLAHVMRFEYQ